jgi:hypothetical protein
MSSNGLELQVHHWGRREIDSFMTAVGPDLRDRPGALQKSDAGAESEPRLELGTGLLTDLAESAEVLCAPLHV